MATTPDLHAEGPGFESHQVWSPSPLYPASRLQRCVKGPERDGVNESRAPGMIKNILYFSLDAKSVTLVLVSSSRNQKPYSSAAAASRAPAARSG